MNAEDLMKRNYVLLIDKSGSMSTVENGKSRWESAMESTFALARKCGEFDQDGIDVFFFNSGFKEYNNITAEKAQGLFNNEEPMGGTDFVPVLKKAFENHFKQNDKPTTILVITDGEPSDGLTAQKATAKLIVETSNKLEADGDLSISFLQVGSDPAAERFLKTLDDDLQKAGAKFDIVDTKTFKDLENMSIVDVLVASIND